MSEPIDLDALKRLAEAATPGPWRTHERNHDALITAPPNKGAHLRQIVADCGGMHNWGNDAAYIAALSPDVALALIAEIESLRAAVARVQTLVTVQWPHHIAGYPDTAEGRVAAAAVRVAGREITRALASDAPKGGDADAESVRPGLDAAPSASQNGGDAHRALIAEAKKWARTPHGYDLAMQALEAATQGPTREEVERAVCYAIHFEYGQDESDVREALRDVFDRLFPAPRKADAVPEARCEAVSCFNRDPNERCTRAPHPDEPEGHEWTT